MTAPTPEKIQRFTEELFGSNMVAHEEGKWVDYSDHLRHLKLAQIEVLEELREHMRSRYANESNPTGSYCNEESLWIAEKIEGIRKEIG